MREARSRDPRRGTTPLQEKLWLLLVEAGLILSLSGAAILAAGLVILITIRELRTPALILIYLALVMMAVPLVTHLRTVWNVVTARTGRYTANTLVMVAAFLSILVLVGFISYENSIRMDFTATKQFTLAPQTKEVLKELKEPVEARVYFKPTDSRQELVWRRIDDFFHEFNRRNQDFTYESIDGDLKPSLARQDGVTEYPTIVFRTPESPGNRFSMVPILYQDEFLLSEQDLVSSLLITTGTKQKTIYFTTGHGERDTENADVGSDGFGFARRGLIGDSYRVCTINLKQIEAMPQGEADEPCGEAEAAALIFAGIQHDILEDERDIVNEYLQSGGSVMFLVDSASSNINSLLNRWGVGMMEGTIVDPERSASGDPRSPIVRRSQYNADSPITKPLDDTFFTEVAAIADIIVKAPEGLPLNPDQVNIVITPLAFTSPYSCVTTNPDTTSCSGDDVVPGPHLIAAAVTALAPAGEDPVDFTPDTPIATIVVFGDSDFASNSFYYAFSNSDLFLNAVDWLTQNYELISIRAKPQAFRHLIITQREFDFIRYSSWFLLPTGVLLLAGIAWWRRR